MRTEKNLKIAVCDDDKTELNHMSEFLAAYRIERNVSIIYQLYSNASDLLADLGNNNFDLFLLDVVMPGLNGMDAAKEIRKFDQVTSIIFLTSSPEFAVASYTVKALDYILKPVDRDRLFSVLDSLVLNSVKLKDGLTIKTKTNLSRILFHQLSYVEVYSKRLYFHLIDGSVKEVYAPLSEFEQALIIRPEFIRVHRSYIVNLWQINELHTDELITHQRDRIPVSRSLCSKVKDAYMELLFEKERQK